jgi:retron-type reverse transcriptase
VRTRDGYLVHERQHLFCYIVGGVVSPLLANIALHGMETRVAQAFTYREGKPNFVRYADDVRHVTQDEILLAEKGGSEDNDLRVISPT